MKAIGFYSILSAVLFLSSQSWALGDYSCDPRSFVTRPQKLQQAEARVLIQDMVKGFNTRPHVGFGSVGHWSFHIHRETVSQMKGVATSVHEKVSPRKNKVGLESYSCQWDQVGRFSCEHECRFVDESIFI